LARDIADEGQTAFEDEMVGNSSKVFEDKQKEMAPACHIWKSCVQDARISFYPHSSEIEPQI
jgi:hypothetical protein